MENFQEIIVLIIVGVAFSIAGYKIYSHLANPLKGCDNCSSDCSGCQLQDLKKEIEENKKKNAG